MSTGNFAKYHFAVRASFPPFASEFSMIFMYLSGFLRNCPLHIGQQNLISWLMPLALSS